MNFTYFLIILFNMYIIGNICHKKLRLDSPELTRHSQTLSNQNSFYSSQVDSLI